MQADAKATDATPQLKALIYNNFRNKTYDYDLYFAGISDTQISYFKLFLPKSIEVKRLTFILFIFSLLLKLTIKKLQQHTD